MSLWTLRRWWRVSAQPVSIEENYQLPDGQVITVGSDEMLTLPYNPIAGAPFLTRSFPDLAFPKYSSRVTVCYPLTYPELMKLCETLAIVLGDAMLTLEGGPDTSPSGNAVTLIFLVTYIPTSSLQVEVLYLQVFKIACGRN